MRGIQTSRGIVRNSIAHTSLRSSENYISPSGKNPLGKFHFLSNIDWSVLNSLSTIEDQLNYFSDMIIIGLNSLMPSKVIKLLVDDTPWMSPYMKDLIHKRQTALKENNTLLFKFYCNRVRERKADKSEY